MSAPAVEIRRAEARELPDVMKFIREHWAAEHVLGHDRRLMDWQHGDPSNAESVNWIIAKRSDEILGIVGYIPLRIFNGVEAPGRRVCWVALWKVRPDAGVGTGLRLLKSVEQFETCDAIGVLGLNPAHPPMYRSLGFKTGELAHFVATRVGLERSEILQLPTGWTTPHLKAGSSQLRPFQGPDSAGYESLAGLNQGIKTPRYFERRYRQHPTYSYDVYEVMRGDNVVGLLSTRMVEANGARALRIIDYAGDPAAFGELGTALNEILNRTGAEYIDLWQHGMPNEVLARLGMVAVKSVEGLIVPNFFEPFVAKNGRIEFAMKNFDGLDYLVMRGDGDQDRPNRIRKA